MKHERSTLPTPISSNSFWHSEPNEFLFGHRTTAELPSEADIVIVGSGITGSSAARFLTEDGRAKGKSIVLLEAREACWGATGRVSQLHGPESHVGNQDEAI
jgi:myosin-crossreactive antigen